MKQDSSLFWSALAFFGGSIITLFGFDLHNQYGYRQSYDTSLHFHLGAGIVILVGIVIATMGLLGMLAAIASGSKK